MDDIIKLLQELMSQKPRPKGGIADIKKINQFVSLPETEKELRLIAKNFLPQNTRLYLKKEASEEIIKTANPKPRLGMDYKLPVIYAGNNKARDSIKNALDKICDLKVVDNIRPTLEEENLKHMKVTVSQEQ